MTTDQTMPGLLGEPVALRAALKLYPARYRRERGDELTAVFADSTAESGRLATAREALDLGAYGLRMRTGLTSSSTTGRLLALAAPLIAGAIAGGGLARGVRDAVTPAWSSMWDLPDRIVQVPGYLWYVGQVAVPLLLVAAVLAGRWRLARTAGLAVASVGVLGVAWAALALPDGWLTFLQSCEATPQLFAGLLFALAPQELLERPGRREWVLVVAGLAAGGLVLAAEDFYSSYVLMDGTGAAVLLLVPLFALLFAVRGRLWPAAVGLAVLPLTLMFSLFRLWQVTGGAAKLLPWALGVATVMVLLGMVLGRTRTGAGGDRSLA
ncbi:hypothetical protein ACFP3U_30320 [Kitasatospora misakiensis]|uniref:Uncharacterized protein n=1 Tax=Kitasatospora misakiensis TaxID=67330 RepID=A0ABW0XBP7_9ACTN